LLTKIAGQLRQRRSIAIVVDDDNHPIGVLTADDLARVTRSVERDRRPTAPLSI
jgi:CBS domain-containing protein